MTFAEAYPYSVSRDQIDRSKHQHRDIMEWCRTNVGKFGMEPDNLRMRFTKDGDWVILVDSFLFKDEKAAFLFKLTFCG